MKSSILDYIENKEELIDLNIINLDKTSNESFSVVNMVNTPKIISTKYISG